MHTSRAQPACSKLKRHLLALACFAITAGVAAAQQPVPKPVLHKNTYLLLNGLNPARVYSTAVHGDTLYLGGEFNAAGGFGTGYGVPVSMATKQPIANFPIVQGVVAACVPDNEGGWFIGGNFIAVGDKQRTCLAHITSAGEVSDWAPLIPNINLGDMVWALAISPDGETLYVGGEFEEIDGATRNNLASFDLSDEGTLTDWNPNVTGFGVYALALSARDSILYAGGMFWNVGLEDRWHLASFDLAGGGDLTDWEPCANNTVTALALSADENTLYAGGMFTMVGAGFGDERNHLASFDLAGNGDITDWDPDLDDDVFALAVSSDGKTLFAGGEFWSVGGEDQEFIASFDIESGELNDWNPEADAAVFALAVSPDNKTVYAGGEFTKFRGEEERLRFAAIDVETAQLTDWKLNANADVHVLAFSDDGSELFIGGEFLALGVEPRENLAAFNANTDELLPWNAQSEKPVKTILLSKDASKLYVGTEAVPGEVHLCADVFAFDALASDAIEPDWQVEADDEVEALALSPDGNALFVGGDFTEIANEPVTKLAALNVENGAPYAWKPEVFGGGIYALAVSTDGKTLYVGGDFTGINDPDNKSSLASFDFGNGSVDATHPELTDWSPDVDGEICALAVAPDGKTLYAGGGFVKVDDEDIDCLAAFDLTGAEPALDEGWTPNPDNYVYALAVSPDSKTVYVGGEFDNISGDDISSLAALDSATAEAAEWAPNPDADGMGASVEWLTLAADGSALYVAGDFWQIEDTFRFGIARFDLAPTLLVLGSDDKPLVDSMEPTAESGTYFESSLLDGAVSNKFTLVNHSALQLTLLDIEFDDEDAPFSVPGMPESVPPYSSASFHVVFAPENDDLHAVAMTITSDAARNQFVVNLAGSAVKAEQTITFPAIPEQSVTSVVALAATASSGLSVTFAVAAGPGVISDDTSLSFTGTGTVAVVAAQAGNAIWNAAAPVTNHVVVHPAPEPGPEPVNYVPGDFTGDGIADFVVYYPGADGLAWYVLSPAGVLVAWAEAWGSGMMLPVMGDYNGDGITDLAMYDEANGLWYIRTLAGEVLGWEEQWGGLGFTPVPGDYDGDGLWDLCVYHEATGLWYARTLEGEIIAWAEAWGGPGFTPVMGDYDGDGKADLCVYCDAVGFWYARTLEDKVLGWEEAWGGPGYMPVPGDYDGDGEADLCVYDTVNGLWYIRTLAGDELCWAEAWGGPGYMPVPGDYDGDGISDLCVYNESTGFWYVRTMDGEVIAWETGFGGPGLIPAAR